MPRPRKNRRVSFLPEVTYFKPAGIPMSLLEEVRLTVDEVEAVRLKDVEELAQEECAVKMNVSRATFQRVLESARKKVAEALLNGKAIIIEGGNVELFPFRFRCTNGHEWNNAADDIETGSSQICPTCNTEGVRMIQPVLSHGRKGNRW